LPAGGILHLRPQRFRVSSLLLLLPTLAAAQTPAPSRPVKLRGYGEVRSHTAIFSFPAPSRSQWVWRRAETNGGSLEYRWDFTLQATDVPVSIGFWLFKLRANPDSGSLTRLFRAGQWTAWGGSIAMTRTVVAGGVDRGWIYMTIRDSFLLAELFADRPATLYFVLRSPGDTIGPFPVQLRYRPEPLVTPQ